jgi:hypothetical protein
MSIPRLVILVAVAAAAIVAACASPSSPSNARLAREHNVLSPQVNLCTQSYLSITPCDTTISRPDTVDTVTVGILNPMARRTTSG